MGNIIIKNAAEYKALNFCEAKLTEKLKTFIHFRDFYNLLRNVYS